ncbi:MAG: ABC transporter substrate-binding protein [Calditrichia bacterium]
MRFMKSFSKFILFFHLIVLLSYGCKSGEKSTQTGKYGGEIKVRLLDNPTDLDPRTSRDAVSYRIIELVYSSLFKFDSTGNPQPEIVKSWSIKNELEYHFEIYDSIYFHNGSKLTVDDIIFTYQWMIDHPEKAVSPLFNKLIKRMEKINDYTFKIILNEIYASFTGLLTIGIVPKDIARENDNWLRTKPIGSGPFIFEHWDPDLEIKLKANYQYFHGRPYLNSLIFKIIPDGNTAVLALNSGDIDFMMNNFNLSNLKEFEQNPDLKILYGNGSNYTYLAFNFRNRYLRKKTVRKAIAHAIDVEAIINRLHFGIHEKANSLLHKNHWAYENKLPWISYNPDKAKELLDQAGYRDPDGDGPATRFTLVYKCTDKQSSRQKAQIIQSYLAKVGIKVDIQANEWGIFFNDISRGMFDLYSATYVGIYDPDFYYNIFHTDNLRGGGNRFYYRNKEMDNLILLSQATLDPLVRRQYLSQIQFLAAEDLPVLSLWHEKNVAVMKKNIENFTIYPAAEYKSFERVYLRSDKN